MGGSGGHMKHPFEVRSVQSGLDLLNMFNVIVDVLSDENLMPPVKLDGANTSFKVINDPDSVVGVSFALDRGSQSVEDVEGITLSNVRDRFSKQLSLRMGSNGNVINKNADWYAKFTGQSVVEVGDTGVVIKDFTADKIRYRKNDTYEVLEIRDHGMVKTTTIQLNLLNKVFDVYPQEAKEALAVMGCIDEDGYAIPEKFLINTEYVDEQEAQGPANVVRYGTQDNFKRFIAFHGLTEIQQTTSGGRGIFAQNYPTYTIKGGSVGRALARLASLIETANEGSGWEFYDVSNRRVSLGENILSINISSALSSNITIKTTPSNEETKTISSWLLDERIKKPPVKNKVIDGKEVVVGYIPIPIMGKKASPVSKNVYQSLINPSTGNAGPLSLQEMVGDNPTYQSNILTGAIFYHATKVVGRSIKSQLTNLSGLGEQNLVTIYDDDGNITSNGHEGVAIQSPAFGKDPLTGYDNLIKIVGDFLYTGMFGRFAPPERTQIKESKIRKMIRIAIQNHINLF